MQRNKQGFIPMVRPLKATLLAAAMSAGAFTTNAHAVAINVTRMEFYPPTQTSPSHVNATVTGSIDFTAGTGGFNSGGTNFFFNPWTATVVQTWEAPGSYTFAGVVPPGGTSPAPGTTYSYSFTLGANQYAAGLFFNWSTNTNIPVLAVFECVGNTTQLLPVNTDGDVSPGTAMQTAPFPSQTAAFTGELQAGLCPGAPVVVPSVTNDGGATLSAGSVNPTGNGSATLSQVISAGIPMDNTLEQQCVGGCFDFVITGLTQPQAVVVLPLSAPIPAAPTYRKWTGSNWVTFDDSGNNDIASAAEVSPGVCPPSGYASGMNQGHQCIQLTIVDGGPNDMDGAVNGQIVDPGGIGERVIPTASTSLSGGGCTIQTGHAQSSVAGEWLLLAGTLLGLGIYRRRTS